MKVASFACRPRSTVGVVAYFDVEGNAYDWPDYSLVESPFRADLTGDFLAAVFAFVDNKEEGTVKTSKPKTSKEITISLIVIELPDEGAEGVWFIILWLSFEDLDERELVIVQSAVFPSSGD